MDHSYGAVVAGLRASPGTMRAAQAALKTINLYYDAGTLEDLRGDQFSPEHGICNQPDVHQLDLCRLFDWWQYPDPAYPLGFEDFGVLRSSKWWGESNHLARRQLSGRVADFLGKAAQFAELAEDLGMETLEDNLDRAGEIARAYDAGALKELLDFTPYEGICGQDGISTLKEMYNYLLEKQGVNHA